MDIHGAKRHRGGDKDEGISMLALFNNRPCLANDLTIRHLERKLKRFDKRIKKPAATQSDYITRDRLALQLAEARSYLC